MITAETKRMYEIGFAMGPLDGKKAFRPGGFHNFTRSRDLLNHWARTYPNCNWGGISAGVMVLDEDPRNGGDLDALFTSIGTPLPDTLTVRTGGGGRHLFFRYPGKLRGKLDGHDGIDLKTWRTGYTVMPGSVHPTGKLYVLERDLPILPLPVSLLPLVQAPTWSPQPTRVSDDRRADGLVRRVADATAGDRNQITFWALCRALERGSSGVVPEIRAAALSTGLTEREFDTCLRSAQRTTGRAA